MIDHNSVDITSANNSEPKNSGCRTLAVVVHYGKPQPTIEVANHVSRFPAATVVIANDLSARPPGLDPQVEWLVPSSNLGYGAGFTAAVEQRDAAKFVVLNNDIAITREVFDRCLTELDATTVGIVAPVLRFPDGTLQSGAGTLRPRNWLRPFGIRHDPEGADVDADWVTGAIMFMRREIAQDIGFDGSYFLGCEDVDLCIRARRAGYRVRCLGSVSAIHLANRVIGLDRWTYYSTRNPIWFIRDHYGTFRSRIAYLVTSLRLPRVAMADVVKRRKFLHSRLLLMGLADSAMPKRSREQGPYPEEPIPAKVLNWR